MRMAIAWVLALLLPVASDLFAAPPDAAYRLGPVSEPHVEVPRGKVIWHAQNAKMVEALTEKKYDVNYTRGIRSHSNQQGRRDHAENVALALARLSAKDDPEDPTMRSLLVPERPSNRQWHPKPFAPRSFARWTTAASTMKQLP